MELLINGKVPGVPKLMRQLGISREAAERLRRDLSPEPEDFLGSHDQSETQSAFATEDQTPAPEEPINVAKTNREPSRVRVTASTDPRDIFDPTLKLLAELVSDTEELRKATANRVLYLTTHKRAVTKEGKPASYPDGSPKFWGLGYDEETDPSGGTVAFAKQILAQQEEMEREVIRQLERSLKRNPLGPWIKQQKGLGAKTVARLLACVGDPYWNPLYDRPRRLSELWEFCGHGGPSRKRKGQQVTWSPEAKMRLWNMVQPIIKGSGPYRDVYDDRRAETADRTHNEECVRCGPAGKPAAVGSAWNKGHQHADAMRIVGKEILRDLWIEARRIHGVS